MKRELLHHCWAGGFLLDQTTETLSRNGYLVSNTEILEAFVIFDSELEAYYKDNE